MIDDKAYNYKGKELPLIQKTYSMKLLTSYTKN